jgi:hypothetical protein
MIAAVAVTPVAAVVVTVGGIWEVVNVKSPPFVVP